MILHEMFIVVNPMVNPLVMTFTVRHGKIHHAFLIGKPSISMVNVSFGYLTVRHGKSAFLIGKPW